MKKMLFTLCMLCMLPALASAGSSLVSPDESNPNSRSTVFPTPTFTVEGRLGGSPAVAFMLTDYSNEDYKYTITRVPSGEVVDEIIDLDSGTVYEGFDFGSESGTRYEYSVSVTLKDMSTVLYDIASATVTTPIETPELHEADENDPQTFNICGSINLLQIFALDYTAGMQLFRASSPEGPFLIVIQSQGPLGFYMDDVKPNTTFYYKVRSFKTDVYSDFSAVLEMEGKPDYYEPGFTATWNGSGIEVTLTDRSYADTLYWIDREYVDNNITTQLYKQSLPDSGQVITFVDYGVLPGKNYLFILHGLTVGNCENEPHPWNTIIKIIDILVPVGDYVINSFTLVDPATDQDIGPLVDGAVIDGSKFPNIRANADAATKCVTFFLNGHRQTDNGPPIFTYFNENNGDYKKGLTQPGHYILKATPSSKKNGHGTVGATVTIEFDVVNPDYVINSFTLVNPATNQDIGPLEDGDVIDISLLPNIRANASPQTKAVLFFLNGRRYTDNDSPFFVFSGNNHRHCSPGHWAPGHYVLSATPSSKKNGTGIVGETVVIEFDAVCSNCQTGTHIAAKEETKTTRGVNLYPNPVVSESFICINASPGSNVTFQLTDEFGRMKTKELKASIDTSGSWIKPIQELALGRGIYIVHVTIDGERFVKRFVVN